MLGLYAVRYIFVEVNDFTSPLRIVNYGSQQISTQSACFQLSPHTKIDINVFF